MRAAREHRHAPSSAALNSTSSSDGAARRVVERDDEAAVAHQQRHHAAARDATRVAAAAQRLGLGREGCRGRPADSPSCGRARSAGRRARRRPCAPASRRAARCVVELLLRPAPPAAGLRSTMPSERQRLADAHHRHLVLALDRLEQLLAAVTICCVTSDVAELAGWRISSCTVDRLVDLEPGVARCCSTSTSPIFGPTPRSRVCAARGMNMPLDAAISSGTAESRNRPNSVSTWPTVWPSSSPPPASSHLVWQLAALAPTARACGSRSGSGSWQQRRRHGQSDELVEAQRDGRSCRRHLAGGRPRFRHEEGQARRGQTCDRRTPVMIWHGSVSVCSVGAG